MAAALPISRRIRTCSADHERVSGQRYADLMSELLWQRIGAADSAYITVDRLGAPRAAGGMCTTTRDLALVGQMMVEGGTHRGRQVVLKPGSRRSHTTAIPRRGTRARSSLTSPASRCTIVPSGTWSAPHHRCSLPSAFTAKICSSTQKRCRGREVVLSGRAPQRRTHRIDAPARLGAAARASDRDVTAPVFHRGDRRLPMLQQCRFRAKLFRRTRWSLPMSARHGRGRRGAVSKKFYDAVLGAIGVPEGKERSDGRIFYRTKFGVLEITRPIDGKVATHANGGTSALHVKPREGQGHRRRRRCERG